MLVVQHRTGVLLSLQNRAERQTGQKGRLAKPAETQ
jgi:hypothetical protein